MSTGGGHTGAGNRRPYMPSEHMWGQSESMHIGGHNPMGMQNMPKSGPYMVPGMVPGMMPSMQMMGVGKPAC